MLDLKIRKVGNSLGVVLPREAVRRMNVEEGDTVYLTETPEGGYRMTAFEPDFEEKMEKAKAIMNRYRNTLHTLAK